MAFKPGKKQETSENDAVCNAVQEQQMADFPQTYVVAL